MANSLTKYILAAAFPFTLSLASPVHLASGTNTPDHSPESSSSGCTMRILVAPELTFGPVRTVWSTTSTSTELVYCGTCSDVVRTYLPFGVPPAVFFDTTVTATGPSVTTDFACGAPSPTSVEAEATASSDAKFVYSLASPSGSSPSPSPVSSPPVSSTFVPLTATPLPFLSKRSGPTGRNTATPHSTRHGPSTISVEGAAPAHCTSYTTLAPDPVPNRTLTKYLSTSTATSSIDCGGCKVVCDKFDLKFLIGPPRYVTTVTATTASSTMVLACSTAAT